MPESITAEERNRKQRAVDDLAEMELDIVPYKMGAYPWEEGPVVGGYRTCIRFYDYDEEKNFVEVAVGDGELIDIKEIASLDALIKREIIKAHPSVKTIIYKVKSEILD